MNDVSPGKLTLLIGAAVTFIFSWLPWYSISGFGSNFSRNAWQSGTFPMATWAPVLALVVGFIVAAETFKFLELPEKVWEFTLDQIVLILSIFALLVTISYLIVDKGGASMGFGLIVCFIGTVAMVAGYFLDKAGVGVNPNATTGDAGFQQPGFPQSGQQPGTPQGAQYPPAQAPPAQQPPAQAPPVQQAPPAQAPPVQPPQQPDSGTF